MLRRRSESEYFKWFLGSLLFGGRISELIAKRTYRAFERHELTIPSRILDAGWEYLVDPIMRHGGYISATTAENRRRSFAPAPCCSPSTTAVSRCCIADQATRVISRSDCSLTGEPSIGYFPGQMLG